MDPHVPTRANGRRPAPHTSLFPQIQHGKQRAMLATVAHCLSVTAACAQVGISRQTHYGWLRQDPAYAAAFADAHQLGIAWLEDVAIQRATAGDRPSDVLLIFLLKAARPDKYRDAAKRDDRSEVSELLKAVLLELTDRVQGRNVTPAPQAAWAPLPPGERRTPSPRPPLPAPPGLDEDVAVLP
jgi:hypothetical protein